VGISFEVEIGVGHEHGDLWVVSVEICTPIRGIVLRSVLRFVGSWIHGSWVVDPRFWVWPLVWPWAMGHGCGACFAVVLGFYFFLGLLWVSIWFLFLSFGLPKRLVNALWLLLLYFWVLFIWFLVLSWAFPFSNIYLLWQTLIVKVHQHLDWTHGHQGLNHVLCR